MLGSSSSPSRPGQGGSSPPPPPGNRGGFGSSSSPPLSLRRDGRTPQTAVRSIDLERNPGGYQYVVRDITRGIWILTTLDEARQYASDGLTVLDSHSFLPVTDWTIPLPPHDTTGAFARQLETVDRVDQAVWEQVEGPYLEKGSQKGTPKKGTPKPDGKSPDGKKDGSPGGNRRSPGAGGAGAGIAA